MCRCMEGDEDVVGGLLPCLNCGRVHAYSGPLQNWVCPCGFANEVNDEG